jgi:hypothetical protein
MATVTRPHKSPSPSATPAPPSSAEPQAAADLDPLRPHFGDRIAFAIWVICGIFMASLLPYDTVMGLFR